MEYIKLMFLSMVPVIELRGAIPLGMAMDLNPISLYLCCVTGSTIIGIPIVLLFRQVIDFLRYRKYFNKVIRWVDIKIEGRAKKLKAVSVIGIILFVGIPLPTTGSWSAAALASIFKMRIKDAVFGIFIGNCIAGAIMLTILNHLLDGISIEKMCIILLIVIIGTYLFIKKKKCSKNKKEEVVIQR
ncbi:COG2426 family protein [Paraclostridium bifermentans]|uniref:COG2426 family protein n=1 Tax=Paraclostridium bifermentans TaxID=1490 RepID=UPI0022E93D56|nr:small multi-drug export protein [Paraclostridium bifermentans]